MSDLREQLEALRARVARIDSKYAAKYAARDTRDWGEIPEPEKRVEPAFPLRFVEEWLTGEQVETPFGRHFETEKLYERHRRHGSAGIGDLADLPADLFETLSDGSVSSVPPEDLAFLDTETTGLAGGTGTCAFLVGVGRITPDGFRVRQFFMRDYAEEASLLAALDLHLKQFRVLVTYNGRTFDQPLL